MKNRRIYRAYYNMKQRCHNKNCDTYPRYGGKGICVCDEWLNSYAAFKDWAINNGYADDLTVDRIDPKKGYSPDNCQWITKSENSKKAWQDTGSKVYAKNWWAYKARLEAERQVKK